jgi:hypothetical protein
MIPKKWRIGRIYHLTFVSGQIREAIFPCFLYKNTATILIVPIEKMAEQIFNPSLLKPQ